MSRYEDQLALVQQAIHQRNIAKMKAWAQEEQEVGQLMDKYSGKLNLSTKMDSNPNELTKNFTTETEVSGIISRFNTTVDLITRSIDRMTSVFYDKENIEVDGWVLPKMYVIDTLFEYNIFLKESDELKENLGKLNKILEKVSTTTSLHNKIVAKRLLTVKNILLDSFVQLEEFYIDTPGYGLWDDEPYYINYDWDAVVHDAKPVDPQHPPLYPLDVDDSDIIKTVFPFKGAPKTILRTFHIIFNKLALEIQEVDAKLENISKVLSERYGSGMSKIGGYVSGGSIIHSVIHPIHKQDPIKIITGNTEDPFPKRYY